MTQILHDFPDWQRSLETADLDVVIASGALNAGTQVLTSQLNMKNYSSFSMHLRANQVAVATAFNPVIFTLRWNADAAGTRPTYLERYSVWAHDGGFGAFQSRLGTVHLVDSVKGSFLDVLVDNRGADNLNLVVDVTGNSRSQGRRYLSNVSESILPVDYFADQSLVDAQGVVLAAAAQSNYIMPLAPGLARVRMVAQATLHAFAFLDPMGRDLGSWAVPAGGDLHEFMALPHAACLARVTNLGAVAGTHFLQVVTARDNW